MAKIARKYLAHYINLACPVLDPEYERLGRDLEEFTPELSPQVERKKNILGERSVIVSGYEKTVVVDPIYGDMDDMLFDKIQSIIDGNLLGDDLRTDVVEVKLWEPSQDGCYRAVRESAYIVVNSYGGDTNGYRISFTLHYVGDKKAGMFNPVTKVFTPAS